MYLSKTKVAKQMNYILFFETKIKFPRSQDFEKWKPATLQKKTVSLRLLRLSDTPSDDSDLVFYGRPLKNEFEGENLTVKFKFLNF